MPRKPLKRKAHIGLNPKHERFCQEFVIDLNGRQAATRAGYSARSAHSMASLLLTMPDVQARIAELKSKIATKLEVSAERVIAELAKIGFCNMADFMSTTSDGDPVLDFGSLTRDQTAALQEVTVDDYTDGRGEDARDVKRIKFRLCDKRAALVDLGKHLGLFVDRHEHSGPDGQPLIPPTFGVWFPDGFPGVDAGKKTEDDAAVEPSAGG